MIWDRRSNSPLTINGSGVPLRPLVTMEPPAVLFGVLQLLPPEELPPLLNPLVLVVAVLRLSPLGRLEALNFSGDGVLLCVSETTPAEPLVVRDSGIGMLPPAGELEFRFTVDDGGLARLGDEAAISTGEMVVCSYKISRS